MSRIVVHHRVAKYLRKLPAARKDKVKKLLEELGEDLSGMTGVKPMAGEWTGYRRVQLGDLRVIFWLDPEKDVIYVDYLGPRGDIYK